MAQYSPAQISEILYIDSRNTTAGNSGLTLDTLYTGTRLNSANLLVQNRTNMNGNVGIYTTTPRQALEVTGNTILTAQGSGSTAPREFGLNGSYDTLSLISPVGLGLNGTTSIFFGLNSLIYYPVARIVAIDNGNYSGSLGFQIGNGQQLYQQMRLTTSGIITANAAFLYATLSLPALGQNICLNLPSISTGSIVDIYVVLQQVEDLSIVHMVKFTAFLGTNIFVTNIIVQSTTATSIIRRNGVTVSGSNKILVKYSDLTNSYTAAVNYMIYGPASAVIQTISITLNDSGVTTVPGVPSAFSATPGNETITLNWDAPPNGGSPITLYTVQIFDSSDVLVSTRTSISSDIPMVFTGLINGSLYTFKIFATNDIGPSGIATLTAVPATVPTAPTSLSVSCTAGVTTISWTVPSNSGGSTIIYYTISGTSGFVDLSTISLSNTSVIPTIATYTITNNVTYGTSYIFTVVATNSIGSSPSSSPSSSITPTGPPAVAIITNVVLGATSGSAIISWTAPSNTGGATITSYTIISTTGSISSSTTYTSTIAASSNQTTTVTGLTLQSSYTFTVTLTNSAGSSPPSDVLLALIIPGVPDAPTDVLATPGIGAATIIWTAPASNGGSEITSYSIQTNSGSPFTLPSIPNPLSYTITGLSAGSSYTFRVTATNISGSTESAASASITIPTVPSVPQSLTAVGGDLIATLTWTAPSTTGGSPITGYKVYDSSGNIYNPTSASFVVDTGSILTTTNATTIILTGLTNGTTYTLNVKAVNAVGSSLAANFPSVLIGLPSAPLNLTAISGDMNIVLNWLPPSSTGGSAIRGYKVYDSSNVLQYDGSGNILTATLTGLTNGTTYVYTVVAINSSGTSEPSAPVSIIAGLPGTPTSLTSTADTLKAVLSWSSPPAASTPISNYRVFNSSDELVYDANGNVSSPPFTSIISPLVNGTQYTFSVYAINIHGRSSIPASISVTPGLPDPPTNLSVSSGNSRVILNWNAPTSGLETGYIIYDPNGTVDYDGTGNLATTATLTGLTNGTTYTFFVKSLNAVGTSIGFVSISAVPFTVPNPVVNLTATTTSNSAILSWRSPSNGGSQILGYKVYDSSGNIYNPSSSSFEIDTDLIYSTVNLGTNLTLTGLSAGTYVYTVYAVNSAGKSASTTISIIPGVPDKPTNLTAIPGNGQVVLSWTAPSGSGLSYTIVYSGITIQNITSTTRTISSLTNLIEYTFSVYATNSFGNSLVAASISVTPGLPYPPTGLTAAAGVQSVRLNWVAPSVTGGSAITGYAVSYLTTTVTVLAPTTNVLISGLTTGTSYTFTVKTTNANGSSVGGTSISITSQ
jgi:hypothetical protein